MKLYAHQQRFIDRNPDRALLVWEGGLGKSLGACCWRDLPPRKNWKALVVCPKSIIKKWHKELQNAGVTADVVSRDDVKKMDLTPYRVLILDEGQDFASPLYRGRSQRTTVIYNHLRAHPETHVLILTATPVRSTPWNIHTLASFLGKTTGKWGKTEFENHFFRLVFRFGKRFYEVVPHWQRMIRPYIEEIADVVLMRDCVDVPTQHNQEITIPWSKEQEKKMSESYAEPTAKWHERHRLEQGEPKFKELQSLLDQYRKVIVVCYYTEQIEDYKKRIGSDREVFVLNGATKDQDAVIRDAQEADDCVFIVQASMGAGFDADQFSVVIFASMSFKYVDYAQMKYRVKRIHNLHENTFIHLLGGKCDRAVYNAIQENRDFDVHEYLRVHGART